MIALALLAVALAAPAASHGEESETRPIHSMHVRMPKVTVTTRDDAAVAPGYIFITPRAKPGQRSGPMILDRQGRVVWYHVLPKIRQSVNLRPQVLNGEPVLTWSQRPPKGKPHLWYGGPRVTYHVIADRHYRILKRIRAKGSVERTDLHAFKITDRGTALVIGYRHLPRDLSRYGGSRHGEITDSVIQEIDIASGKLLFSWSAARHVSLSDSLMPVPDDKSWDFFHANSVSVDLDGNLLVSARHTSAVYRIDRHSGRIIWILGGRRSSFQMGDGASFHYQHDAQRLPDGTLTVFDNAATAWDEQAPASSLRHLKLDMEERTAELVASYPHPASALATAEGNGRVLPNGNVFAGWGSSPWISEHAPDGRLVFAAHLPSEWWHSYRAFKGPWSGRPGTKPAVVAARTQTRTLVYASWNGALEVARWQVLAGAGEDSLRPVATRDWEGLETRIAVPVDEPFVQVEALDAGGRVLGRSEAVQVEG